MDFTRRTALAGVGSAALSAVAGCLGGVGGDGGGSGSGSGGSGNGGSGSGTPIESHPASADLTAQPALGSPDASATIVIFEDPSCPTCRNFEQNAGKQLRNGPVADGDLRFVSRVYPIIYPWGKPAVQALEAVYARDVDVYWDLFDYYFASQSQLNGDNVLDRTASFLSSNTDLDGDAVAADAEAKAYDDAVQTDLAAGEAAGVTGTPTVFLFRDGEYRTRATGSVSFDLVTGALEL